MPESLSAEERALLERLGTPRHVTQGTCLARQGEAGLTFWQVTAGELGVERDGEHIASFGPGDLLGEMALFNADVRTSSIHAKSDCELLEVDCRDFFPEVHHGDKAAVSLMMTLGRTMTRRLQERNQEIAQTEAAQHFQSIRKQMMTDWALKYHKLGGAGKLEVVPTKAVGSAADLSIAYSPGVADPCLAIAEDAAHAYDYTAKGHLVGVVSNGTAVLGLGDIGALAGKPVMEGKAVLFKRFADVDAFDIEVDEKDPQRLIDIVCALEPTFGGINLEDIKAPECFEVERECQRRMNIPVFHDDQHGTAIVAGAGLLNALELVEKDISQLRVVVSGKGAAGFTCAKYFIALGVPREQVLICDRNGVVYTGRGDSGYVAELAVETEARSIEDAMVGADVFLGLSKGNLVSPEMLRSMAPSPLVFALANPTPEIDYETARATRDDVIMATGRSDYPNQINNVIAFPYIFRGALDCRARAVDEAMKHAATEAIARLARSGGHGPDRESLAFGPDFIIPKPFDSRLLVEVASAVAGAAMQSGLAGIEIDLEEYRSALSASHPGAPKG